MAATGIGNAAGMVPIFDNAAPKIIGGLAKASTISGGVFVMGSTGTGVVSSGTNSFVTSDILFAKDASGLQFNGIAVQTAGSNQPIAVATDGFFLLVCNGSVHGGQIVGCDGHNSVRSQIQMLGSELPMNIGRAVTAGASGGYAVIHINA